MQDNPNYSYVSTVITTEGDTHYIKDSEARDAISSLETSKQDVINNSNKLSTDYITGLATVATSGNYEDLANKPHIPEGATVDTAMSDTSQNAVQNKVIKAYVDGLIAGLGHVLNFKGTKTSETAIKAITSATIGDVWINTADGSEWFCKQTITTATATAWEKLGFTIDLSGYAQTADLGDLAFKDSASGKTTPAGSVTINSYTPEGSITIDSYKPEGSISMNNFTPAGTISKGTGTANYTPEGSISINSFTPTGTISKGNGTANYTPEGTVSTPTITVTPNTTTVNSITAVGTLPELDVTVANETLSFSFNQGTLPTKGANTTVATGIKSATSSQPTFSGTGAELKFAGTQINPTGSFTGTGAELKFTGTATKPTGSFTGTSKAPTGSFSGTAKAPTGSFSGTEATVTVS